jgi:3-deoxy-D-manno-octulosonic-acid transferase
VASCYALSRFFTLVGSGLVDEYHTTKVSRLLTRFLYNVGWYVFVPAVVLFMLWRSRKQPAYRRRMLERFGYVKRLSGKPVIWVHAVSMGEVIAAEPLVNALLERYPDHQILVTTITPTGSERVVAAWGNRVEHCYLSYDLYHSVKRFLSRTQPVCGFILETELWPNLYRQAQRRGTKLMLCNARLSEKSMSGYLKVPGPKVINETLACLTVVAAQTEADRQRYVALGANSQTVVVAGNVKFDLKLPDDMPEREAAIRQLFGERPVWVAASTHPGEEEIVLAAHRKVLEVVPNALFVLVPRHPDRFKEVAELLKRQQWTSATRSSGARCAAETQVFLGDSMGEMLSFYAASDVAFVAGSFAQVGGHNVLEPAALKKPVVCGPQLYNFERIAEQLRQIEGMRQVEDADALGTVVANWLQDPASAARVGNAAYQLVANNRGALERHLDIIERDILGK